MINDINKNEATSENNMNENVDCENYENKKRIEGREERRTIGKR